MTFNQIYHSKVTLIGGLHAEKIDAAVLIYLSTIAFPASLLTIYLQIIFFFHGCYFKTLPLFFHLYEGVTQPGGTVFMFKRCCQLMAQFLEEAKNKITESIILYMTQIQLTPRIWFQPCMLFVVMLDFLKSI